jgi:hypothetical protein
VVASEPTTDAVVAALRGLFQQPTP